MGTSHCKEWTPYLQELLIYVIFFEAVGLSSFLEKKRKLLFTCSEKTSILSVLLQSPQQFDLNPDHFSAFVMFLSIEFLTDLLYNG